MCRARCAVQIEHWQESQLGLPASRPGHFPEVDLVSFFCLCESNDLQRGSCGFDFPALKVAKKQMINRVRMPQITAGIAAPVHAKLAAQLREIA